ncbi:hypothetical protein [Nocardia tengchongensis]|uniref:hypothetical protein n=1 Tax=Nocardia tengchongensis TaxID=2055889 RepID=UPI0036212B32
MAVGNRLARASVEQVMEFDEYERAALIAEGAPTLTTRPFRQRSRGSAICCAATGCGCSTANNDRGLEVVWNAL